uniref:Neutral ceramidase n=1 Tax=Timema monikensis TaxID=170555 RepID=A0A7R9E268_9NEOP|nr:unnamed protein product [Timema monikensis]
MESRQRESRWEVGWSPGNVLTNLQKLYGGTYTEQNLLLSGTHTHSAPGGFMMDLLYDISILGFLQETFDAYVDGITMSVRRAHENTRRGRIFINMGEVEGANINRSPMAYENNPETERRKYVHTGTQNNRSPLAGVW